MSRLDVVIFGATGFTGKYAVEEMVRLSKKYPGVTWGVAGRSETKLRTLMLQVAKKTSEDLSKVKIILADVNDYESLKAMCDEALVVANCCGPYQLMGEQVVRAALHSRTHYVDVSGEPLFMERMQLLYDAEARAAGVCIISACGFDSIPNDMGVIYMQQKFGGTLNSVESYLTTYIPPELYREASKTGVIHYATWESLVYSLANDYELRSVRQQLFPRRLPPFEPRLPPRRVIHKRDKYWCLPFPGSDGSVVYRTQRHLLERGGRRPVQFKPYFTLLRVWQLAGLVVGSLLLYLLSKTELTRRVLLRHPRAFSLGLVSRQGPSEAVMNATKFTFMLYGEGWGQGTDVHSHAPDKKLVVKVSGTNPGYGATVSALLLAALTVPKCGGGGVLTTGVAFKDTDLIEKLNDNNITFQVIDDPTK